MLDRARTQAETDIASLPLQGWAATAELGAALAEKARAGDVIALSGGLGTGKTVLARGFIQALVGADEEVPSPTFTLVQTYEAADTPVYHFDLYRLEEAEEAWELGIEDAFAEGISLIEWPDRLGAYLPRERLDVRLETVENDPDARRARLSGAAWADRLDGIDATAAGGAHA